MCQVHSQQEAVLTYQISLLTTPISLSCLKHWPNEPFPFPPVQTTPGASARPGPLIRRVAAKADVHLGSAGVVLPAGIANVYLFLAPKLRKSNDL